MTFDSENVLSVQCDGCVESLSAERVWIMAQFGDAGKLGKNEFYKCPFPHVHPKHKQAFFKDFDSHFRRQGRPFCGGAAA